jgi:hypothetical protein
MQGAVRPAIINDALARRHFNESNPVGQLLTVWDPVEGTAASAETFAIVGVSASFRDERPPHPVGPAVYLGRPAFPGGQTLAIRTSLANPLDLVPAVRAIVHDIDPKLFVYLVTTLDRAVAGGLWQQRLQARVLAIFAVLAVLLAVFGIYSVVSYTAALRTHELGIRVALGATRGRVIGLLSLQGARSTAIGIAAGALAALWLAPLAAGLLYDVSPTDPATFGAAAIGLFGAALLGTIVPAMRAPVDPLRAIRTD